MMRNGATVTEEEASAVDEAADGEEAEIADPSGPYIDPLALMDDLVPTAELSLPDTEEAASPLDSQPATEEVADWPMDKRPLRQRSPESVPSLPEINLPPTSSAAAPPAPPAPGAAARPAPPPISPESAPAIPLIQPQTDADNEPTVRMRRNTPQVENITVEWDDRGDDPGISTDLFQVGANGLQPTPTEGISTEVFSALDESPVAAVLLDEAPLKPQPPPSDESDRDAPKETR